MALFEKICGARLTYSYIRIGGVFNDAPPGWLEEVALFCDTFEKKWKEYYDLLIENQIFVKRTANVGRHLARDGLDFGLTGPMLRGSGRRLRPAARHALHGLRRDLADGGLRGPSAAARRAPWATAGIAPGCACKSR